MCEQTDPLRRSAIAVPGEVKDFFEAYGGKQADCRSLRLLPSAESARLVDNWLRYGFPRDRQFIPIAEDENGDLFCIACAADCRGQIFHLPWSGDEEFQFATLDDFIAAHVKIRKATAR
jgi:hypothetical protein